MKLAIASVVCASVSSCGVAPLPLNYQLHPPHARYVFVAIRSGNFSDEGMWDGGIVPYCDGWAETSIIIPHGIVLALNRDCMVANPWGWRPKRVNGTLVW